MVQNVIINGSQGNALNLVVAADTAATGDGAWAEVQQALRSAGLPTFSITQAKPSLDDVYLAATGRTLTDAALAETGGRKTK
jgi:ABC-2 type transport system ATP-binding protein